MEDKGRKKSAVQQIMKATLSEYAQHAAPYHPQNSPPSGVYGSDCPHVSSQLVHTTTSPPHPQSYSPNPIIPTPIRNTSTSPRTTSLPGVPVENYGNELAVLREMESRMSAQFKQMNDALQAQRIAFQLKQAGSTGPAETVQPPSPPEPEPYYGEHDPAEVKGSIFSLIEDTPLLVAFLKSTYWPQAQYWNSSKKKFEPIKINRKSLTVRRVEDVLWGFFLTFFPFFYIFLEINMLSGVLDEGYNTKTHITGDGYYQSWS